MLEGSTRKYPPRFPAVDDEIKRRGGVKAFCAAADYTEGAYYKMQSGHTQPTLGLIFAVMQFTGLGFEEAFGEEQ